MKETDMRLLVALMLLFSSGPLSNVKPPQGCLSYDPATVTLSGKVGRKTFAGPPNYESIKRGDEPETYWILRLNSPICVNADENMPGGERPEKDVSDIQLVFSDGGQYARHKGLLGKRVIVSGKLSHAITGHHHTKVLLTVAEIQDAGQKPNENR
jgi:hypothetical protein